MTHDELIERARRGDPDAWRELYETLTGRLLVWMRARPSGDSVHSPEDLVAETWLVAARSIADFAGDREAFAGWLFGIARNHARAARRRTLRRETEPRTPEDLVGATGTYDGPADRVSSEDWTRRLLASLPARESEVITCMDVAGLSIQQTAAALGVSATAVRVARHRGLVKLRRTSAVAGPALT